MCPPRRPACTWQVPLRKILKAREHSREHRLTVLCYYCSVAKVSDSLPPHGLQHARLLCPSLSPRVCSNSCPLRHAIQPSHPLSSPSPFVFCAAQMCLKKKKRQTPLSAQTHLPKEKEDQERGEGDSLGKRQGDLIFFNSKCLSS